MFSRFLRVYKNGSSNMSDQFDGKSSKNRNNRNLGCLVDKPPKGLTGPDGVIRFPDILSKNWDYGNT